MLLTTLRRDLGVVARGLLGRNPPPLVPRGPGRPRAAPTTDEVARTLRVVERVLETRDAVSVVLADPTGAPIAFQPGQFFTVLVDLDGQRFRRAYSASSDPRDSARVRLTIKRVRGGLVSNHLNDTLHEGAAVRVLGPSGSFVCAPEPTAARHVVLIGGGSGITPLMSIAIAVLAEEPRSSVTLIYGNRAIEDVIYLHDLDRLAAEQPDRFRVHHVLETPPEAWTGAIGRLDRPTVAAILEGLEASLPATYYVCGPEPMMRAARAALEAGGVAPAAVHEERFSRPDLRPATGRATGPQPIAITAAGTTARIVAGAGQTVLDAGLQAGVPMPFSCAMGGCGACKVKLTAGVVAMEEPSCLSAGERAEGYVLACVSRAEGPIAITVEPPR